MPSQAMNLMFSWKEDLGSGKTSPGFFQIS